MIITALRCTFPNITITIFTLAKVDTIPSHPIPDWLLT